jgi:hypothetical protein
MAPASTGMTSSTTNCATIRRRTAPTSAAASRKPGSLRARRCQAMNLTVGRTDRAPARAKAAILVQQEADHEQEAGCYAVAAVEHGDTIGLRAVHSFVDQPGLGAQEADDREDQDEVQRGQRQIGHHVQVPTPSHMPMCSVSAAAGRRRDRNYYLTT